MKWLMIFALFAFGGCSVGNPMTEEKVRVIASFDTCYELSLRHSEAISNIRVETDYASKQIPQEWNQIYANQRHMVHKSPFYCDLWLNNPDFVDEVKVLLK